jgi:formylmethanofuran dehydrogenase subunit E
MTDLAKHVFDTATGMNKIATDQYRDHHCEECGEPVALKDVLMARAKMVAAGDSSYWKYDRDICVGCADKMTEADGSWPQGGTS